MCIMLQHKLHGSKPSTLVLLGQPVPHPCLYINFIPTCNSVTFYFIIVLFHHLTPYPTPICTPLSLSTSFLSDSIILLLILLLFLHQSTPLFPLTSLLSDSIILLLILLLFLHQSTPLSPLTSLINYLPHMTADSLLSAFGLADAITFSDALNHWSI